MTLAEALLPAAAAAEPVDTETYDNAEGKVRSNCNVLTAVEPAVKGKGRVTGAPAFPVAEPTPTDGGAGDAIAEKPSIHLTALYKVTQHGVTILATTINFPFRLSG